METDCKRSEKIDKIDKSCDGTSVQPRAQRCGAVVDLVVAGAWSLDVTSVVRYAAPTCNDRRVQWDVAVSGKKKLESTPTGVRGPVARAPWRDDRGPTTPRARPSHDTRVKSFQRCASVNPRSATRDAGGGALRRSMQKRHACDPMPQQGTGQCRTRCAARTCRCTPTAILLDGCVAGRTTHTNVYNSSSKASAAICRFSSAEASCFSSATTSVALITISPERSGRARARWPLTSAAAAGERAVAARRTGCALHGTERSGGGATASANARRAGAARALVRVPTCRHGTAG
eukprot:5189048-Prymnesium_polylepis.3